MTFKKRFISLILAFILAAAPLLSGMPVSAAESPSNTLKESIRQQYKAYAASVNQTKANENAIIQIMNHALGGRGRTLSLTDRDPTTASYINSKVFEAFFVDTLTLTLEQLQGQHMDRTLMGASINWYDYKYSYAANLYKYNDTAATDDDQLTNRMTTTIEYTGATDGNDKAMVLLLGSSACRIRVNQIAKDLDSCTYRLNFRVDEVFDFTSDYDGAASKGYDTTVTELLVLVGRMMSWGLIDTFKWVMEFSFDITVPNVCPHELTSYRWDYNGSTLAPISGEGLTANGTTKLANKSDAPYFRMDRPVYLEHDHPWALEIRMKGNKRFAMSPVMRFTEFPSLMKYSKFFAGDTYPTAKEDGKNKSHHHQYGATYNKSIKPTSAVYTFRLENRIASDGSNMVWLLIDGNEIGPLNEYYYDHKLPNPDQPTLDNWISGKDFFLYYLFNYSYTMQDESGLEYIAVWENGDGGNTSTIVESGSPATCTEGGIFTRTCTLCSAQAQEGSAEPLGHSYEVTQVVEPSCAAPGYSTYTCTACGDTYDSDHTEALPHSWLSAVTQTPTAGTAGTLEVFCTGCGDYQVLSLPALSVEHYTYAVIREATAVEEGLAQYTWKDETYGVITIDEALARTALSGDLDADGALDVNDAIHLLFYTIFGSEMYPLHQSADFDHNGSTDTDDAIYLLFHTLFGEALYPLN